MSLYKFRTIKAVLGDYHELERGEMYFASYDELNDPFEGLEDIYWQGDIVLWKNLLRHFLLCLDCRFTMAQLYPQKEANKFYDECIGVFRTEEKCLTTDIAKNRFAKIKREFFSEDAVTVAVDYLSKRRTPVREELLGYVLHTLVPYALRNILTVDVERGLTPLAEMSNAVSALIAGAEERTPLSKVFDFLEGFAENHSEKLVDDIIVSEYWAAETGISLAVQLTTDYKQRQNIDLPYFTMDFSREYVRELSQLVHNRCYSASFANSAEQTVMWSHYADYHRGVCLVFKTEKNNWTKPKLGIPGLRTPAFVEPIDYSGKPIVFDFFRSLYRYNWKDIENVWHIDDDGNRSKTVPTFDEYIAGRDSHIEKTISLYCTKKSDWGYENEQRAILYDTLEVFSEKGKRCIKYDFSTLEGIIFGIKTSMSDKLEIIRRIYLRCDETKRTDFKFYQARHDQKNNKIAAVEIKQLRFNFKKPNG